jgi:hypothetical protein
MYDYGQDQTHPVKGPRGIDTPGAAAALVIGALVFLILVRRGFRGVNVGGVGVSVR